MSGSNKNCKLGGVVTYNFCSFFRLEGSVTFLMMSVIEKWIVRKVRQSESVNDVILKEDLFMKFNSENPEVPREVFFAEFGRIMGCGPFKNVVPFLKKGKKFGYRFLSFKKDHPSETKEQSNEKPEMNLMKETCCTNISETNFKQKKRKLKLNKGEPKNKNKKLSSNVHHTDKGSVRSAFSAGVLEDDGNSNSAETELGADVDCSTIVTAPQDQQNGDGDDDASVFKRKADCSTLETGLPEVNGWMDNGSGT